MSDTGINTASNCMRLRIRFSRKVKILYTQYSIKSWGKLNFLQTDQIPYYNYLKEVFLENDGYKLYWDSVHTDLPFASNIPDVILVNKLSRKIILIVVAIVNISNLLNNYDKIIKYTSWTHKSRYSEKPRIYR